MSHPTLTELDAMSEKHFDREVALLERLADRGDQGAQRLVRQIDDIVNAVGTFDLRELPDCPFTLAHTRHWCGNPKCRDS